MDIEWDFEGVGTTPKLGAPNYGVQVHLPLKILKFRVSKMPFPTIIAERFYK